jgi:hypothetical protein
MLRIHGDRSSLLAALTAHWADQQLQIPQALRPWWQRSAAGPDRCAERTSKRMPQRMLSTTTAKRLPGA